MKFGEKLPRSLFEILKNFKISKFQKSERGKCIPKFPLKHVITSTNLVHTKLLTNLLVPKAKKYSGLCNN